jgi:hypothetical protein
MRLVFKKNPNIKIEAPSIKTIRCGKTKNSYGWYIVKECTDSGFDNVLGALSMAFWELTD